MCREFWWWASVEERQRATRVGLPMNCGGGKKSVKERAGRKCRAESCRSNFNSERNRSESPSQSSGGN